MAIFVARFHLRTSLLATRPPRRRCRPASTQGRINDFVRKNGELTSARRASTNCDPGDQRRIKARTLRRAKSAAAGETALSRSANATDGTLLGEAVATLRRA